jgi:ubiquinone/menaquinone biosynthesis C-methylase UbiE
MAGSSKQYFDTIGSDWDRLQESFYSDRVRERALTEAGVLPGCEAADVGAGTGFITQGLIQRRVRVIAVDQSRAMLDALRRKFPWPDRVDCRIGEAEQLPIADASVDYCFANMVLHHVESPPAAIAEMVRILKPGGKAVVTDLDTHVFACLSTEHHDRWMGFDREDVRKWFRAAGLAGVRVDGLGEQCCTATDDGHAAPISIFIASGAKPPAGPNVA